MHNAHFAECSARERHRLIVAVFLKLKSLLKFRFFLRFGWHLYGVCRSARKQNKTKKKRNHNMYYFLSLLSHLRMPYFILSPVPICYAVSTETQLQTIKYF